MLIRINLLPVRQVKKREMGRQILVLFGVVLTLGLVVNFMWYQSRDSVREANAQKIQTTRARITELEKAIGEVNNINKRKKDLEEKLKVLADLRKGRAGPVRLMDALATSIPKKVWIKEFDENANAVRLTGSALSHEDVSELMRSLGNVVWTPKGMGRLVEQRRDAKTSRVELLAADGAVEDFPVSQVSAFFTGIKLKNVQQVSGGSTGIKSVDFEISLAANYIT